MRLDLLDILSLATLCVHSFHSSSFASDFRFYHKTCKPHELCHAEHKHQFIYAFIQRRPRRVHFSFISFNLNRIGKCGVIERDHRSPWFYQFQVYLFDLCCFIIASKYIDVTKQPEINIDAWHPVMELHINLM